MKLGNYIELCETTCNSMQLFPITGKLYAVINKNQQCIVSLNITFIVQEIKKIQPNF